MPEKLTLHALIDIIFATLDARDSYTFEHSYRVAKYSEIIAKNMGLSSEDHEKVHYAAHLHDIGKIGIPDSILNKPGILSVEDRKIMQSHSKIGYDVLNRIPMFVEIADIVLHHHERYDGLGYPNGIKGVSIPLGSRIIAVADSFDAMTSTRTYRKSICFKEAAVEINKHSGDQFDPDVVEYFNMSIGDFPVHVPDSRRVVNMNIVTEHEEIMHSKKQIFSKKNVENQFVNTEGLKSAS